MWLQIMYSEELSSQALDALMEYFQTVEQTGHFPIDKVEQLMCFMLVDDFLNTELNEFVSEEDHQLLSRFLYCIYGRNCLLPYPDFVNEVPHIGTVIPGWSGMGAFRLTESKEFRYPERTDRIRTSEYETGVWSK